MDLWSEVQPWIFLNAFEATFHVYSIAGAFPLLSLGFITQQNDSVHTTLSTSSKTDIRGSLRQFFISSDQILESANRQNKLAFWFRRKSSK
jgi:hypothetical protein